MRRCIKNYKELEQFVPWNESVKAEIVFRSVETEEN